MPGGRERTDARFLPGCAPGGRNRTFGGHPGHGLRVEQATAATRRTTDGVTSAAAILALAHAHGVEMPITGVVSALLSEKVPLEQAAGRVRRTCRGSYGMPRTSETHRAPARIGRRLASVVGPNRRSPSAVPSPAATPRSRTEAMAAVRRRLAPERGRVTDGARSSGKL
ncbi:NAD(P)H-dependent glycerol-3-phosphate dehydrogenase [Streptomyces sp. NBC_00859]|uniref:NAD(P)H-dependent glycerol-3-phosphate dehydrogenase n=1 Tax=Streptomyces sp. NBC_00859 TaxID=2903682 RepID=UPI0038649243|nr:hypothetical protein OG584_30345 [Streptomyces sp. NBC_00859]